MAEEMKKYEKNGKTRLFFVINAYILEKSFSIPPLLPQAER